MKKCTDHVLSRRNLLTVGAVGGLSLSNFFRLKQAQADQKHYESKEGTAKSVIFYILTRRNGTARDVLIRSPTLRLSIEVP